MMGVCLYRGGALTSTASWLCVDELVLWKRKEGGGEIAVLMSWETTSETNRENSVSVYGCGVCMSLCVFVCRNWPFTEAEKCLHSRRLLPAPPREARGNGLPHGHVTCSALRPPPSAVAGSSRHLRRYFLQCLRIAYCVSRWWRQGFSTSAPALRQQDQSRAPPRDPEAPLVAPAPLLAAPLPPPSSAGMAHTPVSKARSHLGQ